MLMPVKFAAVFADSRLSTCDVIRLVGPAIALFRRLQAGIMQTRFTSFGADAENTKHDLTESAVLPESVPTTLRREPHGVSCGANRAG